MCTMPPPPAMASVPVRMCPLIPMNSPDRQRIARLYAGLHRQRRHRQAIVQQRHPGRRPPGGAVGRRTAVSRWMSARCTTARRSTAPATWPSTPSPGQPPLGRYDNIDVEPDSNNVTTQLYVARLRYDAGWANITSVSSFSRVTSASEADGSASSTRSLASMRHSRPAATSRNSPRRFGSRHPSISALTG